MDEAVFLSRLLLLVSIVVLVITFLVFPDILNNPDNRLNMSTLKDVWQSGDFELPVITKLSSSFATYTLFRYIILGILVLVGILAEFFSESRKKSGMVHIMNLTIGMLVGTIFLFSLVVPFMPL